MHTIQVYEVDADAVRHGGFGDEEILWSEVRDPDLPEQVERVILDVSNAFDEAHCPVCYANPEARVEPALTPSYEAHRQVIGWWLDERDDGRASGGFTPFWVLFDGTKAWPVCEGCAAVLFHEPEPRSEPGPEPEPDVPEPKLVLHFENDSMTPTRSHDVAEHCELCDADVVMTLTLPEPRAGEGLTGEAPT